MMTDAEPLTGRGRLVLDLPGEVALEDVIRWSRGLAATPLPWELWGWRDHPGGAQTWEIIARGRTNPE